MISKFLFAILITSVAVLYQIDVRTDQFEAFEMARIQASSEQISRFIANPDNTEKWFHWVSGFKAADSRPLGKGKKYHAIFNLPFIGEYIMLLKVLEYVPNQLVVIESEAMLKPRFTIQLKQNEPELTQVILRLEYKRSSALFQWTAGPVLWFLTKQQLQKSLFLLRMMFPF